MNDLIEEELFLMMMQIFKYTKMREEYRNIPGKFEEIQKLNTKIDILLSIIINPLDKVRKN